MLMRHLRMVLIPFLLVPEILFVLIHTAMTVSVFSLLETENLM